jgi:acylphosphatase
MSDHQARRLRIHGHVQGVFYRDSMRREAQRLGVTGWVRNRTDGTVEAHVEGPAEALEALFTWAGRGPQDARVTRVESSDAAAEGARSFEMRPTA